MKIHLISCHSILEYDLLKIFTALGHDVFSNGAYLDPAGHPDLPRPGVPEAPKFEDLAELARQYPKTNLPPELIDPFDVIFFMHSPEALKENWEKIKHKKVIFYSIGQSTPAVENLLRPLRAEGLKIVRMSPMEKNIIGYVGEDKIIRFAKDPNEWQSWNGKENRIINMTQSLRGRRVHTHHDSILAVLNGFPSLIYGSGNDDLGSLNGGDMPYDLMKGALRDNRGFIYGGTWPSPYTLAFMEAWMTGIPMICLGKNLAEELQEIPQNDRINYYEIPEFIRNRENGFISDNINELRGYAQELLADKELAERISAEGRKNAIDIFGVDKIKDEWKNFFNLL